MTVEDGQIAFYGGANSPKKLIISMQRHRTNVKIILIVWGGGNRMGIWQGRGNYFEVGGGGKRLPGSKVTPTQN